MCPHLRSLLIHKLRDCAGRNRFSPRYPKDVQDVLVQNVFLTGGNVMYPGMKVRIEKELLAMRPFQSSFQVLTVHVAAALKIVLVIRFLIAEVRSKV